MGVDIGEGKGGPSLRGGTPSGGTEKRARVPSIALPCVQRVRKLKRCAHGASVDHVNYDPTGAQGPGVPGYLRGCAPEAYLSNESEYIHVVSLFNIL